MDDTTAMGSARAASAARGHPCIEWDGSLEGLLDDLRIELIPLLEPTPTEGP